MVGSQTILIHDCNLGYMHPAIIFDLAVFAEYLASFPFNLRLEVEVSHTNWKVQNAFVIQSYKITNNSSLEMPKLPST